MYGNERGVVNQTIRDILDETDLTDARKIAVKVIEKLGLQDPVDILMEIVVPYVWRVTTSHRRSIEAEIRERHEGDAHEMSISARPTSQPTKPISEPLVSRKWQRTAAIFRARHTATAGTKLVGKFDRDDILAAIEYHKGKAAGHMVSGMKFEKLLAKFDEYGVELVEQLPVHVVEEIFR